MASSDKEGKILVLGQFGKVHGLKGWLKLTSFTSPAENILDYPKLNAEVNQSWTSFCIDQSKKQANGLLVHVSGYDDPESAKSLTGLRLSVAAKSLPALSTGDYYWHELEGLRVVNQREQNFGRIIKLLETGANDVLVIAPDTDSIDDRERLIPYLKESVIKVVDLDAGTIQVSWEADYLD